MHAGLHCIHIGIFFYFFKGRRVHKQDEWNVFSVLRNCALLNIVFAKQVKITIKMTVYLLNNIVQLSVEVNIDMRKTVTFSCVCLLFDTLFFLTSMHIITTFILRKVKECQNNNKKFNSFNFDSCNSVLKHIIFHNIN